MDENPPVLGRFDVKKAFKKPINDVCYVGFQESVALDYKPEYIEEVLP